MSDSEKSNKLDGALLSMDVKSLFDMQTLTLTYNFFYVALLEKRAMQIDVADGIDLANGLDWSSCDSVSCVNNSAINLGSVKHNVEKVNMNRHKYIKSDDWSPRTYHLCYEKGENLFEEQRLTDLQKAQLSVRQDVLRLAGVLESQVSITDTGCAMDNVAVKEQKSSVHRKYEVKVQGTLHEAVAAFGRVTAMYASPAPNVFNDPKNTKL